MYVCVCVLMIFVLYRFISIGNLYIHQTGLWVCIGGTRAHSSPSHRRQMLYNLVICKKAKMLSFED